MSAAPVEATASRTEGMPATTFFALLARIIVGGLFVATGWAKVVNLRGFAEEIQNYDIAPIALLTNAAAIVLSWFEIVAGLLLALGLWRRESRWMIGLMLIVFTVVKAMAMASGQNIECGCGGDNPLLKAIFSNPQGIFTNLALLGLLVFDGWAQNHAGRPARP